MDKIEQRIEQIEKFASQCYEDGEKYSAFIAGAIWADNNLAQDVVNLNDVRHDASDIPREKEWILAQFGDGGYDIFVKRINCKDIWCAWCKSNNIIHWAYIIDLLPKGGNDENS